MTQAIAFVLRERGFRAGRFKVAYQSCDDSVVRTGLFDEPKCASNARAYADNSAVVGVIGTFNSACSIASLPELNRAPDGRLAMVSSFNSFVGLTRAGPDVDPSLPAALYPTGVRNFVRVFPTDDLEGAALALFARNRGRTRVFVLDDGEPGYGALQATTFETAARRLGLTVLGRETWDPRAKAYSGIARRVATSGAEAVYVGGLVDTNAGAVVRALRARLGRRVDLLGPSGLTPVSLLVESSKRSALGMYLSLAGVVTEGLPPAGARARGGVQRDDLALARRGYGGDVAPVVTAERDADDECRDDERSSSGHTDSARAAPASLREPPGRSGELRVVCEDRVLRGRGRARRGAYGGRPRRRRAPPSDVRSGTARASAAP